MIRTLAAGIAMWFALAASPAVAANLGINYLWWKMVPVSEKDCRANQTARNDGVWFLPSYQNAKVRAAVRHQLASMHASGFATLRALVFYYHSTDAWSQDSFTSTDGSVSAADRAKLSAFVSDVAAAGFARMEIVPSFQTENWLYCRTKAWGDCFEPSRTAENWRFTETVARTAYRAAGRMALRFDLGNEAAPDASMPRATLENARTYLQYVAGRFQREFGSGWTVSAARSDAPAPGETAGRLTLLLADLAGAHLVPKYLELHAYTPDGNDLATALDETGAIARRIGAAVVLGELRYHSAAQAQAIARWMHQNPAVRVADVIQWPEVDPSAICNLNPVPPYAPGPLAHAGLPAGRR